MENLIQVIKQKILVFHTALFDESPGMVVNSLYLILTSYSTDRSLLYIGSKPFLVRAGPPVKTDHFLIRDQTIRTPS